MWGAGDGSGRSEDVGDVVDDVLVADAPCPVGPPEGEAVVPGLDGRDGAPGAEGAGGPAALGLLGSDDVEGDELGFDTGLVGVDADQVVVGGVVAPAQWWVRRHGRGHGRCDLGPSGEDSQQLHPIGPAVVDLDDCVGFVESCQFLTVAPVRCSGVSGNDLSDLVFSAHEDQLRRRGAGSAMTRSAIIVTLWVWIDLRFGSWSTSWPWRRSCTSPGLRSVWGSRRRR